MIFELEINAEASALNYRPPRFVTKEITGDPMHNGFALANGPVK